MRLLLHIGSSKTGSSALQQTLYRERQRLAEAGVVYPDRAIAAYAQHVLFAAIHPGAWNLHRDVLPEDRDAYFFETAAAMLEDARAAGASTLLLSSEYLWGNFPAALYEKIRTAFAACAIEIVAFLRRPDDWLISSYLQAVKSGEARDFETWAAHYMGNKNSGFWYARVLENWQAGVNASDVHVLVYEKDVKKNVYRAFCEAVGLAELAHEIRPPRANPSPDAEGVRLLLEVNRSDLADEEKRARRAEIMRAHRSYSHRPDFVSDVERRTILKTAVPSNQRILRQFVPGERRGLFSEPWPRIPAPAPEGGETTAGATPGEDAATDGADAPGRERPGGDAADTPRAATAGRSG